MKDRATMLDRLLHAAASVPQPGPEMPFGFDTRIAAVALAQRKGGNGYAFGRLLQRVAIGAMVVAFVAGGATWWQMSDSGTPVASAYAIADTAIENGVLR